MPARICPVCRQRIFYDKNNTEFLHDCSSGSIVSKRQEDRVFIDNENYNFLGSENKLQHKEPHVQSGERLQQINTRGRRVSTHTTRDRIVHIDTITGIVGQNPT